MGYDVILWDVDETLLNFKYSEKQSLTHAFETFHLDITEEIIQRYSAINESFWKQLERGEVTKAFLLKQRFVVLFEEYHITGIAPEEFEKVYRNGLSTFLQCEEGAFEVLEYCKDKVRQFVVTNGVAETQKKKVADSGIGNYVEELFISEEMGADKPDKQFFDACFLKIGPVDKEKVLIIGDSLSSDILGGKNAGIHTCWYHKPGIANRTNLQPDYEITSLKELLDIVK